MASQFQPQANDVASESNRWTKVLLIFVIGIPLTAVLGTFGVLLMIGAGLTAGPSSGIGRLMVFVIAAGVVGYWIFGTWWALKRPKNEKA